MLHIHKVFKKDAPFIKLKCDIDSNLPKLPLDQDPHIPAGIVSTVGDQGETEGLSIAVQDSISIAVLPSRFSQELTGALGIVGERFQMGVTIPEVVRKRARGDGSQTIEDILNDLLPVNGMGESLPNALILEERVLEIITDVRVPETGLGVDLEKRDLTHPPIFERKNT
jgi:hypothetical protein